MVKFFQNLGLAFHRLFHPHCEHCAEMIEDEKHCPSCDSLREILDIELAEKRKLLDLFIEIPKETAQEMTTPEPINPKFIPWRIKRSMLEKQSRIKNSPVTQSLEELEKEVLGEDANQ